MRFYSARSRLTDGGDAAEEILHSLHAAGCHSPDLLTLFLSAHHRESAAQLADRIRIALGPRILVGCTCEGVIGVDDEIEREPGVAALAATLPGVWMRPFLINPLEWNDALTRAEVIETLVGTEDDMRGCLLIADPFSTPIEDLLNALDTYTSLGPVFGGMASGANQPGGNALLLDDGLYTEGCAGVTFAGNVRIDTVVSQGCRPVGDRLLVTGAHENLITSFGNRAALEVTQEVLESLKEPEYPESVELLLGIAMNEYQDEFHRGDFLIRNIIGADRATGVLAVGDLVRAGQTVQFHVRDTQAAKEDLQTLLAPMARSRAAGALLFSCNGRGSRMFQRTGHDVQSALNVLPSLPIAGFFAMGEIGPVGDRNYLHGHTASLAFFSPGEENIDG